MAQKTVRHQPPMATSTEALIAEYAAAPTPLSPPTSPLSPWSSLLLQIPSPPLHVPSPPLPLPSPPTRPFHTGPTYDRALLDYRAAMAKLRVASPFTHYPLLPSEIPPPPFLLPSTAHRDDIPEADMTLQKRARFTAPTSRFEVEESSTVAAARQTGDTLARRVDYGFIDTLDASIRAFEGRAMTVVEEVNERVTYLATTQRHDAQELYRQRIDDGDRLTSHIQHEHDRFRELARTKDAGHQDGPTDVGSSY
ncbi:hypothetical protein Tco_0695601 [Tanacetum coccineum]